MRTPNQIAQLPLFAEEPLAAPATLTSVQEPEQEAPVSANAPQEIASEERDLPNKTLDEGQHQRHIVQPYRMTKTRRVQRLTPVDALTVPSAEAALRRAESLFETGRYVGVDAFTTTANPDMGEYGEPVFHARLGEVPRAEYGE